MPWHRPIPQAIPLTCDAGAHARECCAASGTRPLHSPAPMNILLTPARIGSVEIPNRIVMPPMTTRTADAEGYVTDDSVAYYLARVK